MNDNKRYSLIILVLFAAGAVFTVVWGMFLNFGKLTVQAEAPFQIDVITGPSQDCTQSPCQLELKPGKHTVVFRKNGFKDQTQQLEIKRWGTNEIKVDFQFIPTVEEVTNTESTPEQTTVPQEALTSYLNPDGPGAIYLINQNGKQALILKENDTEDVLSYFPKPFLKPTIFVDDDSKTIAVVESLDDRDELYLIDVESSNKKNIFQSASKIQSVAIAPDGQNIAVLTEEKGFLVKPDGTNKELDFDIYGLGLAWYNNEKLALLSTSILNSDVEKTVADVNEEGITFEDYLTLLEVSDSNEENPTEIKEITVTVYLYDITNDSAQRLVAINGTTNLPAKIEVKEGKIYFYDNLQKKYQVIFQQ